MSDDAQQFNEVSEGPLHLCGWDEPKAKQNFQESGHLWRQFELTPVQGLYQEDPPKKVLLWNYSRAVLGGKDIPNIAQEVGDCVSWGHRNAVDYLACVEIVRLGEREVYKGAFPPYIYGISRVQIGGGRIGGDGSVGEWAAKGLQQYGSISFLDDGCPQYSGSIARKWGSSGPPDQFIQVGKNHLVKTYSQVRSWEDVKQALLNCYPVTVCSNRGFQMQQRKDSSTGKMWGVPQGSWGHCLSLIGIDVEDKRPGAYIMNSWGPNAHSQPGCGEPPGGFWADADVIESMVRQDDSFTFSQYDGYPEQKIPYEKYNTIG